jgi:hypothetical protein
MISFRNRRNLPALPKASFSPLAVRRADAR